MLADLRAHHAILERLVVASRQMPTEPVPIGVRLSFAIYLNVLEDAVSVLNSIIEYLDPDEDNLTRPEPL
jgi:hypothetical protein